jgi:saccharopine dehydrogenase (NAD+, L-lysine-forming)
MINYLVNNIHLEFFNDIKIGIIGANGRCGKGVQFILDKLNIKYIKIIKEIYCEINCEKMTDFDIIFNCILLDEKYDKTWFDHNTVFIKDIVIIDISCDYQKDNNPIKLYNNSTSWKEPVFVYNKFVDIIAIENLPSLLPYESSINFSNKCTDLLLQYGNNIWKNNLEIFYNAINKKTDFLLN